MTFEQKNNKKKKFLFLVTYLHAIIADFLYYNCFFSYGYTHKFNFSVMIACKINVKLKQIFLKARKETNIERDFFKKFCRNFVKLVPYFMT
jgi:hypothetical protein